jgi:hypothetical protein
MLDNLIKKIQTSYEIIFHPYTITIFLGPQSLWGGLFIGILWGFVLQKAQVSKYDVVARLFMLQEFTVFRVGAPLLATMTVILFFFHDIGIIKELAVPKTLILAQILGGLIMGAGIAIAGYCPGTSAAALGEGALDTLFFMLGMFCASALFAEIYPFINKTIFSVGDYNNITVPELLGINHWLIIIPFFLMLVLFDMGITLWDWFLFLIFLPIRYSRKSIDEFEKYVNDLIEAFKRLVSLYFIMARKVNATFVRLSTDPEYTPREFIKDIIGFIRKFSHDPINTVKDIFSESDS